MVRRAFAGGAGPGSVMPAGGVGPQPWSASLRRPDGLVEHTRWLFSLCACLSVVLTAPAAVTAPLPPGSGATRTAAALSAGALLVSLVLRYRHRSASPALDLLDVLCVLGLAAASPAPAVAFGATFSVLWLRALYGTTRGVAAYCTGLAAATAAAVLLWELLPGHPGSTPAAPVLGALPVLFLTTAVARHLALGLFAREQSQQRDAVLAQLGARLLGITDRSEVYRQAWAVAGLICRATPGMRALVVSRDGTDLEVHGHAGAFVDPPARLPLAVVPAGTGSAGTPVRDTGALDRCSGFVGRWVAVALPEDPAGTMLLGAPGGVPADGQVAIRSMMNQVALALRTSDAHRDLEAQAHTDGLTGLANRAALSQALEAGLQDPTSRPALLFVDLDDFKRVNDGLGHSAGDELLRHVADRLRAAVSSEDLCARLGGDEFAVLLRGGGLDAATAVARCLVETIGSPVLLGRRLAQVGASVGVCLAGDEADAELLLQRADAAMYAAKSDGKGRVRVFDAGLQDDQGQQRFEHELRLAAGAGQLRVHYQPIVRPDGTCTSLEALVRWQHPDRGLLGPVDFVAAAERTGAIVEVGAAVLREACAFVAGRTAPSGRPLTVHVNVSAAQLTDPSFVATVRSCVQGHGLAPAQLVLEITESMVLDAPAVRATLDQLVRAGAALAVDDFGTGYSALTTLRTLPLSIVKIDKSFVAGYPGVAADHAVVDAIVHMAVRLGMTTVAEGVERPEQVQVLADAGVSALQGFLFARPAPGPEVAAWLDAQGQAEPLGRPVLPGPQRAGTERGLTLLG